jgi:CRP-like cAMP-binding protein
VREGDRPSRCCALIEGFACRSKMTSDGKRQIFAFHVPGDIPDLQSVHLRVMDHTLCTVTLCKVGFIHHEDMHRLFAEHSRLVGVFWRDTLIDAAIFRHWMLGIGRKSAYGRIGHLFCELFIKLQAVGLTQDHTSRFPSRKPNPGIRLGFQPSTSIAHSWTFGGPA